MQKSILLILLPLVAFWGSIKGQEAPQDSTFSIRGKVSGLNTESLPGALVILSRDPQVNSVSNEEGDFELDSVKAGDILQVSCYDFLSREIEVETAKDFYHIILEPDKSLLQEVVVVGYATQRKVDMTGAVSTLDVSTLADRPVTNVADALAGLAPGLTVTNSGGTTPGYESQTIRVRGQGTLNDAAPLIVIDGVTGLSLSDINPQDIESISVLKDAASSAIYGSRAANGVILITTKKGSQGAARITYRGNVSFETVSNRLNLVTDYADFMEIQNAALIANGQAPRFSQGKIDEWRDDAGKNPTVYPNTDWQDHIYRNPSVVQNHNISLVGGRKNVHYNISLGYINNPGMIYYTNYERYQMRTNIDINVRSWLAVGANVFGYVDKNNPNAENATAGGDVIFGSGAFNTVPGMTLYDPTTGIYGGVQNPEEENVSNYNPYRRQWFYKSEFPVRTRRVVANVFGRLMPIKGLSIEGSFTYNYWDRNREEHLTDRDLYRFTLDGPVLLREGTVRTYIRKYGFRNTFRTSDIIAKYNFRVSDLEAMVMAGYSQEYNRYEEDFFMKYDLIDESMTSLDGATTNGSITGNYTQWAMRSWFGRINLNWNDRYLLEGNLRADGSSRFAPSKRWGVFPSVSAGWRIDQENFMFDTREWLSNLKLRVSYGSLGNNATTNYYMYQSLYATANAILNGNIAGGFAQTVLANPALTWERTRMADVGLDFGFFDSRLSGTFDWYDKYTSGILISLPAPLEHGTSTVPNQNAGELRNVGFDFDINWSDYVGSVAYSVGFNIGYVRNKVTKFQGEVSSISGVYKLQEGKPFNQLYVLKVDRIVRDERDLAYVQQLVDANPDYFSTYQRPELGDFLYADANGDGHLDADDRVEIGHGALPSLTFGANIGVAWNNFDFSMLLQGVGDYKVYYNNQAFRFVTVMGQSLNKDITDNAWTPENPYDSKYPRLRNNADGRNNVASDAFVHDASYLRCKNIQLGYTIPQNLTKKILIERLKFYVSIDNLFTITRFPGLDPEVGATVGYPLVRQYSIGVDLSF